MNCSVFIQRILPINEHTRATAISNNVEGSQRHHPDGKNPDVKGGRLQHYLWCWGSGSTGWETSRGALWGCNVDTWRECWLTTCVYTLWNLWFCAYFHKIFFNKIHARNLKNSYLGNRFQTTWVYVLLFPSCGNLCCMDGQHFPFAIGPLRHNYIVSSCYFLSYFLITF